MRTPPARLAGAVLLCAIAGACATASAPVPPPRPAAAVAAPVPAAPSTADRLLEAIAKIRGLDEAALAAQIAASREAALRAPSDLAHVEAALALAASPVSDETQILEHLTPILREAPPADPDLRAMAGFLQAVVNDRRKLREGLQAASAKSRDDRREAQSQRQRADAQQERADRLQQKLEALTNLEKSLANRKHADDPNRRPR